MATKLTPALVAAATGPNDGKAYNLLADSVVTGLGLRTTKAGANAGCFPTARTGISCRLTIGTPRLSLTLAARGSAAAPGRYRA